MKHIPNISFQNKEKNKEFEWINLAHFFSKTFTHLNHNPAVAHRIQFFALLMVTNGSGSHNVDLVDYPLEPGSVLKIAKGQIHSFQEKPTYEGFLIIFTEDFVLKYFSKSSISIISHLYNYHVNKPIAYNKKLNDDFLAALFVEHETQNLYAQKDIIAALLNLYLLRLERESNKNKPENNPKLYSIFLQFKNLVESKHTITRNVKDYATELYISTKSLNQLSKDFTLNTAKTFIDNYVVLEAKRAIVSTNKSLKEISFDLGFDEVTNFTKFFKNKTGLSPKDFRNTQY